MQTSKNLLGKYRVQAIDTVRYAVSFFVAILIPPIFYHFYSGPPWLGYSYSKETSIFEYFGFSVSLFLMLNMWIEIRRARRVSNENVLVVLLFSLVAFFHLLLIAEFLRTSHDYLAYQEAVRRIIENQSVYGPVSPPYIYPPLLAQILAFLFLSIRWIVINLFSFEIHTKLVFFYLFYLYQCLQFTALLVSYLLSYLFARRLNHTIRSAAILVTLIFIVNTPLIRNFHNNQINLWILISIYLVILLTSKLPVVAGIANAIGAHLKIYPALLVIPWLLAKKWKAIVSAFLAGLIILYVSAISGNGKILWSGWLHYLNNIEKGVQLRNNSLHSFVWNLLRVLIPDDKIALSRITSILVTGLTILVIIWVTYRFYQRMRMGQINAEERLLGNMMDTIILMVLVSPSVWEHHLVILIPVVIWASSVRSDQFIGLVGLAILLIYAVPTFDVFLVSYHRLVGIFLLLLLTPPAKTYTPIEASLDLFADLLDRPASRP